MHHFVGVTLILAVLGLLGRCSQRDSYDVLALLPLVSPRNHQFDEAVLMALARRGHRVTVYSQFPPDSPHPRYRHVLLDEQQPDYDYFDRRWESWKQSDYVTLTALNRERFNYSGTYVKYSAQLTSLKENLESGKEHYDVVITEPLDGQEHLLLFTHWAKASAVVLEPYAQNITTNLELKLEPKRSPFSLISFLRNRLSEILPFYDHELNYIQYLEDINAWLQMNYKDPPAAWDLVKITPIITFTNDLVLNNVTYPTVRLKGVSIHYSPLPKIVRQFLYSTDKDVVVIDIDKPEPELDTLQPQPYLLSLDFLIDFLPIKFLWSSATIVTFSGRNVLALPRIPRQVLKHRNCKLMITDGDLLRIQEAFYYGVPVLVVPQTSYQKYTAAYLKAAGVAEVMDPEEFKRPSKLLNKVHQMLNNNWYKRRAEEVAQSFRSDLPDLDSTVHYSLVEAVVANKKGDTSFWPAAVNPIQRPYITSLEYLSINYLLPWTRDVLQVVVVIIVVYFIFSTWRLIWDVLL